MAVVLKVSANIFLLNYFANPAGPGALLRLGIRPAPMKRSVDGLRVNSRVRIKQRLDHLLKNSEQLRWSRAFVYLWAGFLVDCGPVDLAASEKWIVLGEGPPKHFVVRLRSIGSLMATGFGKPGRALKRHARNAPVVQPEAVGAVPGRHA